MKRAVFAGVFDPFTIGHLDIATRSAQLFDEVVIAVGENGGKNTALSTQERLKLVRESVASLKNVCAKSFSGLLNDFLKKEDCSLLVRGLRSSLDFEYERQLCEVYVSQQNDLEIVYFITGRKFCHISSTLVRELAALGGDLRGYVAQGMEEKISCLYHKK